MTIWAFNSTYNNTYTEKIYKEFKSGKSRFGWSQEDEHNLRLENNRTKDYSKQLFLLQIKKGDWIVNINNPKYGKCIAGQVVEEYGFDKGIVFPDGDKSRTDFRHFFLIDASTIIEFDRNDERVDPLVSRRLKLQGRYWRIRNEEEFKESIGSIKKGDDSPAEDKGSHHLRKGLGTAYDEITKKIHDTHPGKDLEDFFKKVFEKTPNVVNVKLNRGRGTDHGADIIVVYSTDIDFINIEKNTLVVQVKSYEGEHHDTKAVDQIKTAIDEYVADAGVIITTGKSTEALEKGVTKASEEKDKPISLIAGEDVAKFVLKYYGEELY